MNQKQLFKPLHDLIEENEKDPLTYFKMDWNEFSSKKEYSSPYFKS